MIAQDENNSRLLSPSICMLALYEQLVCGADSSFTVRVDPKLYSFVGCVCVDSGSEAVSKVDAFGEMTANFSCCVALLFHLLCRVAKKRLVDGLRRPISGSCLPIGYLLASDCHHLISCHWSPAYSNCFGYLAISQAETRVCTMAIASPEIKVSTQPVIQA